MERKLLSELFPALEAEEKRLAGLGFPRPLHIMADPHDGGKIQYGDIHLVDMARAFPGATVNVSGKHNQLVTACGVKIAWITPLPDEGTITLPGAP
jgi:hypothetical protein